jgi:hypothetical protein
MLPHKYQIVAITERSGVAKGTECLLHAFRPLFPLQEIKIYSSSIFLGSNSDDDDDDNNNNKNYDNNNNNNNNNCDYDQL